MNRISAIAHDLAGLWMMFAGTFVLPLAWSLAVEDGIHMSFVIAGAGSLVLGLVLRLMTRHSKRELLPRESGLLVVVGLFSLAALAAVPFLLALPGMSITDAFFEASAGLTTTGATVITGLEYIPQSLNIWRHAMQWYGGMGIIVLAVAILPVLGVGGMQLFKGETPGPMKEGKLTPRVTQTARHLWLIYAVLTAACMVSLHLAGLSWFESVTHAFSALSLGGFSTRDAGIESFDLIGVEVVLGIFMMIAVTNFATHFTALRQRSLKAYINDSEAYASWLLIIASGFILAFYLYDHEHLYPDFLVALRHALFGAIALGTSSGYGSTNYGIWPIFGGMWILLLGCVASSAGSTGGGIKMIRALILLKQTRRELARIVHPKQVKPLAISGQPIPTKVIMAVLGFMLLYGVTITVLIFVMLATGMDFMSAVTGVISIVNNIGPALGLLGPSGNYAQLSDFQTWVMAIAMIAGRLELLTFAVIFTLAFWRR